MSITFHSTYQERGTGDAVFITLPDHMTDKEPSNPFEVVRTWATDGTCVLNRAIFDHCVIGCPDMGYEYTATEDLDKLWREYLLHHGFVAGARLLR